MLHSVGNSLGTSAVYSAVSGLVAGALSSVHQAITAPKTEEPAFDPIASTFGVAFMGALQEPNIKFSFKANYISPQRGQEITQKLTLSMLPDKPRPTLDGLALAGQRTLSHLVSPRGDSRDLLPFLERAFAGFHRFFPPEQCGQHKEMFISIWKLVISGVDFARKPYELEISSDIETTTKTFNNAKLLAERYLKEFESPTSPTSSSPLPSSATQEGAAAPASASPATTGTISSPQTQPLPPGPAVPFSSFYKERSLSSASTTTNDSMLSALPNSPLAISLLTTQRDSEEEKSDEEVIPSSSAPPQPDNNTSQDPLVEATASSNAATTLASPPSTPPSSGLAEFRPNAVSSAPLTNIAPSSSPAEPLSTVPVAVLSKQQKFSSELAATSSPEEPTLNAPNSEDYDLCIIVEPSSTPPGSPTASDGITIINIPKGAQIGLDAAATQIIKDTVWKMGCITDIFASLKKIESIPANTPEPDIATRRLHIDTVQKIISQNALKYAGTVANEKKTLLDF